MNAQKNKGPIIDPGVCRCCGLTKKCRLLNVEYEWLGQRELYSDMLFDCFSLLLSHLDGEPEERLICANCVVRLRDATSFRKQVLQCEETLLKAKIHGVDNQENLKTEADIKEELDIKEDSCHDDYADEIENHSEENIKTEHPEESTAKVTSLEVEASKKYSLRRVSKKEDVRAKKDLMVRMRAMKKKLIEIKMKKKKSDTVNDTTNSVKLVKTASTIDKDQNSIKNAITIVENSYVCPFLSVHSDYYCAYCNQMITDCDELRQHTMTHNEKTYLNVIDGKKNIQIDVTRIDCRLCDENIDNLTKFKDHITSVHNKIIFKEISNEILQFKLKYGKMICLECSESFSVFNTLRKHMAIHFGNYICDICGAHYFEERLLVLHNKRHMDDKVKTYNCEECGKVFKSSSGKFMHVARIHKNEAAYPCNKCDEVFLSYHRRYKHKIEVHNEKRIFPCDSCDRVYNCRKSLREHNRKNHLMIMKHECVYCSRKFYLPSHLKDHLTTHTGERNFRCEFCGKSYPRLKALKVHMESHNTEKKYKCTMCPASYTQLNNFKNHMKSKHVENESFV